MATVITVKLKYVGNIHHADFTIQCSSRKFIKLALFIFSILQRHAGSKFCGLIQPLVYRFVQQITLLAYNIDIHEIPAPSHSQCHHVLLLIRPLLLNTNTRGGLSFFPPQCSCCPHRIIYISKIRRLTTASQWLRSVKATFRVGKLLDLCISV